MKQKPQKERHRTFRETYKFKQSIFCSNGTIKIKSYNNFFLHITCNKSIFQKQVPNKQYSIE